MLAVKPQSMGAALPRLAALGDGGDALSLDRRRHADPRASRRRSARGTPIVRAMPNTPAAVGRGITALVGNAHADADALALAEALMQAVGQTVRLEDEAQMDAVTAVSGSGPAYVFLLIEALAAAGEAEGLDRRIWRSSSPVLPWPAPGRWPNPRRSPRRELRVDVTSPGGTTAAALEVLMQRGDGPAGADAAGRRRRRRPQPGARRLSGRYAALQHRVLTFMLHCTIYWSSHDPNPGEPRCSIPRPSRSTSRR